MYSAGGINLIKEFVSVYQANKKIKRIIYNTSEVTTEEKTEEIKKLNEQFIEDDYNRSIENKNRFEDKAKTILAALTIAITLILNLSKLIETISEKYDYISLNILISLLAIMAIIYMLMAGIMSIHVLIKENIVYYVSAKEKVNDYKEQVYRATKQNNQQNLVRNNIIYGAYMAIRNSVICLVILFVIAICPIQIDNNDETLEQKIYDNKDICFEIDAVNWINENEDKVVDYDKIIERYNKTEKLNTLQNIYDEKNGILVIVDMENDIYIVKKIISDIETIE